MKFVLPSLMLFSAAVISPVPAQQWSTFQNGGSATVQTDSVVNLATAWSPESGIAWEQELAGYGQSSPVVFEDTIFVTSVTGPNKEKVNVEAFSGSEGTRKWIYSATNSTPQENTVMISRAASTPACDAQGVIAMFGGGNLLALNREGKLRWERDFAAEFGDVKARHGLSASIEQDETLAFIWVERTEAPYIVAVNKADGKTVWKSDGVGATSWGSPRLITVDEKEQLVLSASGKIVGLDPKTGDRLWEFNDIAGNTSVTAIPLEDGKFLIGSTGSREKSSDKPCSGVIELENQDGRYRARWKWSSSKLTCSFGSPLGFDGRGYFVNRSGILNCHDLDSGKKIFGGRISGGQLWATPFVANQMIYFFGKSGVTTIIKPAAKLDVVADNRLWEADEKKGDKDAASPFSSKVLYAAAVSGDRLLLRRGDKLFAVSADEK